MSLSRLATVELQLIMQCCDQRTLLRLARCSRFTRQAASDPFAWRYISPAIISSALCTDEVAPVTASNPARHTTRPSRDDPSQSPLPRLLLDALPSLGFSDIHPVDGAFYLYADIARHTDDASAFCRRMLEEAGVAATPGLDFDPEEGGHHLRVSFAGSNAECAEAVARLKGWLG